MSDAPKTEGIAGSISDAVADAIKQAFGEAWGVILANGVDLEVTPGIPIKIHVSIKRS